MSRPPRLWKGSARHSRLRGPPGTSPPPRPGAHSPARGPQPRHQQPGGEAGLAAGAAQLLQGAARLGGRLLPVLLLAEAPGRPPLRPRPRPEPPATRHDTTRHDTTRGGLRASGQPDPGPAAPPPPPRSAAAGPASPRPRLPAGPSSPLRVPGVPGAPSWGTCQQGSPARGPRGPRPREEEEPPPPLRTEGRPETAPVRKAQGEAREDGADPRTRGPPRTSRRLRPRQGRPHPGESRAWILRGVGSGEELRATRAGGRAGGRTPFPPSRASLKAGATRGRGHVHGQPRAWRSLCASLPHRSSNGRRGASLRSPQVTARSTSCSRRAAHGVTPGKPERRWRVAHGPALSVGLTHHTDPAPGMKRARPPAPAPGRSGQQADKADGRPGSGPLTPPVKAPTPASAPSLACLLAFLPLRKRLSTLMRLAVSIHGDPA